MIDLSGLTTPFTGSERSSLNPSRCASSISLGIMENRVRESSLEHFNQERTPPSDIQEFDINKITAALSLNFSPNQVNSFLSQEEALLKGDLCSKIQEQLRVLNKGEIFSLDFLTEKESLNKELIKFLKTPSFQQFFYGLIKKLDSYEKLEYFFEGSFLKIEGVSEEVYQTALEQRVKDLSFLLATSEFFGNFTEKSASILGTLNKEKSVEKIRALEGSLGFKIVDFLVKEKAYFKEFVDFIEDIHLKIGGRKSHYLIENQDQLKIWIDLFKKHLYENDKILDEAQKENNIIKKILLRDVLTEYRSMYRKSSVSELVEL